MPLTSSFKERKRRPKGTGGVKSPRMERGEETFDKNALYRRKGKNIEEKKKKSQKKRTLQ